MVTASSNSPRYSPGGATLDLSAPLTASSGYTGAPIYGGVQVSGTLTLGALRLLNNHSSFGAENGQDNDVFDLRNTDPTPVNNGRMIALLLWECDYTPGANDPTAGLLGIKALTYTGGYSTNTVMTAYFVLRYRTAAGFAYMISPTTVDGNRLDGNGGTRSIDATTATWYAYDPTTGAGLDNIDTTTPLAGPSLTLLAVSHAGLLFKVSGKTSESALSFYRFAVTADSYRPKPAFKSLYNSDTANVEQFDPPFDDVGLIASIDEATTTTNGVDAFMMSPMFGQVPWWQSATTTDPDNVTNTQSHFVWWRTAHQRSSTADQLTSLGHYLYDDDGAGADPKGDVLDALAATRALALGTAGEFAAIVSVRLNDYHYAEDLDARPGLWNIATGGSVANDKWRYLHPHYRLARGPVSGVAEYHYLNAGAVETDDRTAAEDALVEAEQRVANCLDWRIDAVRDRMLEYVKDVLASHPEMDGIELDFMRSGIFFPAYKFGIQSGEKAALVAERKALMTPFVAKVRNALDELGKTENKRYWLTARVPATLARLDEDGLDPEDLAAAGVDLFVVSADVYTAQSLDLPAIATQVQAGSASAALYYELTDMVQSVSGVGRRLTMNEQFSTAMHLAYEAGFDGPSFFNFAYYRKTLVSGTPIAPPFAWIPDLTKDKEADIAATDQHYVRNGTLLFPENATLTRTFKLRLHKPTYSGTGFGWTQDGRLRLISPAGIDPSDPFTVKCNGTTLSEDMVNRTDEPYPSDFAGYSPPLAGDADHIRTWLVPRSYLVEGENTFTVANGSTSSAERAFLFVDFAIK